MEEEKKKDSLFAAVMDEQELLLQQEQQMQKDVYEDDEKERYNKSLVKAAVARGLNYFRDVMQDCDCHHAHTACSINEVRQYCTFNLTTEQRQEFNAMMFGAKGLNRDLFLVKFMLEFAHTYNRNIGYHHEMKVLPNIRFNVHFFKNISQYKLENQSWFHVVYPSSLFLHGCIYMMWEGTQGKSFYALFETGQVFLCTRSRVVAGYVAMKLIRAVVALDIRLALSRRYAECLPQIERIKLPLFHW